jgi:hypothetical protein
MHAGFFARQSLCVTRLRGFVGAHAATKGEGIRGKTLHVFSAFVPRALLSPV